MRRLAVAAVLLALGVAVAVAALAFRSGGGRTTAYRGSVPPGRFVLPDFALRNYSGDLVRSPALKGKVVVVTFLESRCRESCPIIASSVARGSRLLGPDERGRVVALAISTQPHDDTPASVRAFLRRRRAEGELLYLIGTERELRPVWKSFQILSALDSGDADIHSAPVRIYDPAGVWVSTLHAGADLTPASLRHDIREALGE